MDLLRYKHMSLGDLPQLVLNEFSEFGNIFTGGAAIANQGMFGMVFKVANPIWAELAANDNSQMKEAA